MKKKKNSLIMQDIPGRPKRSPESCRKKKRARKVAFKATFKFLEALLMIFEIVKGILEIVKK